MLNYEEMQYFAAFAGCGTLSEVAEKCSISQPTITRAMKKAEAEFGVPLFDRTKNSIRLNANGRLAADEINAILKQTDDMLQKIRSYDRANRTISIGSGAAVQLPGLIGRLTEVFPDKPISTELKKPSELTNGLKQNIYQLIILPFEPDDPACYSSKIGEEHLMFLLPRNHRFARRKSVSLGEMNGENLLLFSEIGFWADIVKEKMPDSKFLVQNERYTFQELIANSILPCFTSDIVLGQNRESGSRVAVPIDDPEVNVTYFLVCMKKNRKAFEPLFQ